MEVSQPAFSRDQIWPATENLLTFSGMAQVLYREGNGLTLEFAFACFH